MSSLRTPRYSVTPPVEFGKSTIFLEICHPAIGGGNGGGSTHNSGAPKGTYSMAVTASTLRADGTLSHTSTISLTIQ